MDAFDQPHARDRSITTQCVKCAVKVATIEIRAVHRIGFYICEYCFNKLDNVYKQRATEIIQL